MGYAPFSTASADYYLVYADHNIVTHEEIFDKGKIKSLDAIVLEDTGSGVYVLEQKTHEAPGKPVQYEFIAKAAHEAGKPIFLADAENTKAGDMLHNAGWITTGIIGLGFSVLAGISAYKIKKKIKQQENISRRDFIKLGMLGALGAYIIGTGAGAAGSYVFRGEGRRTDIMETAGAMYHRIIPTPVLEARNAISARKIEEFIVPLLQARILKRPKIAVVYGIEHMGIEGCLQHKWWRDTVIWLYNGMDYPGLTKSGIDVVKEISPSGDGWLKIAGNFWNTKEHNCGLF